MIRLLHTADWQIGKPFGGFPPEIRGVLREERFKTVERIAALAADENCDAIVVAGDAFDDNSLLERDVARTLDAMKGFNGIWVMLPGNHDAALPVNIWARVRARAERLGMDNLVIADRPEPLALLDGRLVVLPAPLSRRREVADLTEWFDTAETPVGALRVGLAHGSVLNRLPEAAEAGNPIADDRAARARLAYLALGDWHGFSAIAPRTVYAGTPEPDRYPANEPGHVVLVDLPEERDGGGEPGIRPHRIAHLDWRTVAVTLEDGVEPLTEALRALPAPGRTLVKLVLSGSVSLKERVALDEIIEDWSARLFDLRLDDSDLFDAPDEEDLDAIDLKGFVRVAVERLREKAADPTDPEREAAALALRMAYGDHRRSRATGA